MTHRTFTMTHHRLLCNPWLQYLSMTIDPRSSSCAAMNSSWFRSCSRQIRFGSKSRSILLGFLRFKETFQGGTESRFGRPNFCANPCFQYDLHLGTNLSTNFELCWRLYFLEFLKIPRWTSEKSSVVQNPLIPFETVNNYSLSSELLLQMSC